MKNHKNQLWLFVLLVLPVGKTTQDSSTTTMSFSAGTGQYAYVSRGCEGQVLSKKEIPFLEFNASVDHNASSHAQIGLRASYISTHRRHEGYTFYGNEIIKLSDLQILTLNPVLNINWKYFAIGGGFLWAGEDLPETDTRYFPSAYLRVGNVHSFYVDASVFHKTPLISDGYFTFGFGVSRSHKFGYWIGMGGGPYDKVGLVLKTDLGIGTNLSLNVSGRLGTSENISENAINVGISYRIPKRE